MSQHVKLGLNNKVISKRKGAILATPLKAFFWKRHNYVLGNSQWPFRKANWRKMHTLDPPDTSSEKFPATRVEIGHHYHHYDHHHHHHGHHQVFCVLSDESGDVFCCGSPSHKYCCTRRDQVLQQEMEGWVGHIRLGQKVEQILVLNKKLNKSWSWTKSWTNWSHLVCASWSTWTWTFELHKLVLWLCTHLKEVEN